MTSSEKTTDFNQIDPVPLDPIILRARDELLEKYSEKSFDEQITFYKAVIEGEKDGVVRLSAMAARVYILRKRLALLAGNLMEDQLDDLSSKNSGFDLDSSLAAAPDVKDPEMIGNENTWMRLRIVDSSEVNGVRFPAGVVIDVKREDGEKLIESGKADFISTEESRQFKSEEGLEQNAIGEEAAPEEAVSEESSGEEAALEKAVSEESSGEEAALEEAVSEESSGEEAAPEEAVSEESSGEEAALEKAVSEESSGEEAALEEAVSEESSGEEAAPEEATSKESSKGENKN